MSKSKKTPQARNWGCVTLQFKSGKGAHGTKKGKRGYTRKAKHGKGW